MIIISKVYFKIGQTQVTVYLLRRRGKVLRKIGTHSLCYSKVVYDDNSAKKKIIKGVSLPDESSKHPVENTVVKFRVMSPLPPLLFFTLNQGVICRN